MFRSEIPVGGRLKYFVHQWEAITNDQWVLSVLKQGYKLEFQQIPPSTGIRQTHANVKHTHILMQEVEKLLQKRAIEPVPLAEIHKGFYSTFFLVPKKTGDLRPVINLRPLNKYLRTQHFKMDSLIKVINLAKKGDWAISIDLTDAYLHVPLFPGHRQYLRFCIQGRAFQFTALPFGPKVSPRVFTKIVAVVAGYLRMQNLRLAVYLDDWFLLNMVKSLLMQDKKIALDLLTRLGFLINTEKSQLQPTQQIVYIGGLFDLRKGIVLPPPDRIQKIQAIVKKVMENPALAIDYLQMLGLMASCIEIIPFARLHMRPIQLHLLHWWKPASRDLEASIPTSRHLKTHLEWWLQIVNLQKGRSLQPVQTSLTIATDASSQAWGGVLNNMYVQGKWTIQQKKWHINCLELQAVLLTLENFLPHLKNHNVLIRSDNTTVVQYLNKQGGTRSPQLCLITWKIWNLAIENQMFLKAAHIAGRKNILPDQLSRVIIRPTEWTMNDTVLHQIFQIWGKPFIDLFSSFQNRKMELFCTWDPHPAALAVDALTISWNKMFGYAYPPICLIPKVLEHMKQFQCKIILIAPQWPRRHWYTQLLQLCIAQPIRLPCVPNLLRQPKTAIFHPKPGVFNLNAWLLSTDSLEHKAFLRKLENCSQHHGDLVHTETMVANSESLIAGVNKGKLIRIQLL